MKRLYFYTIVVLISLAALALGNSGQLPANLFTAITASFAYEAYRYNKEKFRLDLFEKRWKVYDGTLVVLLILLKCGLNSFKDNATDLEKERIHSAAKDSILARGQYFLFDKGVSVVLDDIFRIYSCAVEGLYYDDKDFYQTDSIYISGILKDMQNIFSPYLYFGDYKNEQGEKSLCALCVSAVQKSFQKLKSFKSRKDETNVSTC